MQVSKAIKIWLECHKSHSRDNTLKAYQLVLSNFKREFGERDVQEITSDKILSFLNRITEGTKQQTKRTRYAHLSALSRLAGLIDSAERQRRNFAVDAQKKKPAEEARAFLRNKT